MRLFNPLLILTGVLMVIIPLFPKFPLMSVPSTYVAIRIEDLLLLTTSIFLIPLIIKRRKELLKDSLFLAILLFIFAGFVSTLSGIFVTKSVLPHLAILHYFRRIEYVIPFFVSYFAISNIKQVKVLMGMGLVVGVLVVLYGAGQIYFNFPVISTSNEEFSKGLILTLTENARPNSTFAGHFDLAAYLAFLIPIVAVWSLFVRSYLKPVFATLFISYYWMLLKTQSQVSFIAYLVSVSLVFLLLKKFKLLFVILVISFTGIILFGGLSDRVLATLKVGPELIKKIVDLPVVYAQNATSSATASAVLEPTEPHELGVYRSLGIRFDQEWPRAIRAFIKNPLVGTGYSSITLATDNDYLRSLGEMGLLGFLSLSLIFFVMIKRIIKTLKSTKQIHIKVFMIASLGIIASFLVNATFIDVFEASKVAILFWLLMGITLSIVKMDGKNA